MHNSQYQCIIKTIFLLFLNLSRGKMSLNCLDFNETLNFFRYKTHIKPRPWNIRPFSKSSRRQWKETRSTRCILQSNCSTFVVNSLFIVVTIISFLASVLIASSGSAQSLDDGLVKEISFDNRADRALLRGKKTTVPGKFNSALLLDGVRDYVDLGNLGVMEDYTFTVTLWYKSSASRSGWLFSEGNKSSNVPICGLSIKKYVELFCRSNANSSMKRKKTIKTELNDDKWHHVALVGDGSVMMLYIDSTHSGSLKLPEATPNFNMTSIGRLGRRSSTGYIKAMIDEVRIYNRNLSNAEINDLFTSAGQKGSGGVIVNKTSIPLAQSADFTLPAADLEQLFGKAPSSGVHPRILFGPEQLPAIRSRIRNTGSGRKAYAIVKRTAEQLRTGHLKLFYRSLIRGNRDAINNIANCFWKDKARMVMSYEAYVILIENIDGQRATDFAKALTTFAEITGGFYKKDICKWSGADHYALADLAYAYDFAYNKLTEAQRRKIRHAVTQKLKDKVGYGMDMPKNDRIAPPNYQMHGMSFYILNLAFEGEPGFSRSLNAKAEALAWDFVQREIHSDGTPREDLHYFNFGMEHGAEALIAMSRRGHDIINHENYRKMLNWYIYSVEPYGYKFSTHSDTIRPDGGLMDNYTVIKYVWPMSQQFDYVWRNRMGDNYEKFNQFHDYLLPSIFGANLLSESKDPVSMKLPLAFYSKDRGFSVARSSWKRDAISLRFSSRTDLHTTGHYHSDQLNFTLSARGKDWVKDWGYHSYRDFQHNLVLIDGKGQGYFPAASRFPVFFHNEVITTSVGDANYAYTYRWVHKSRKGASGYRKYRWEIEPNVDQSGRSNTTWRSVWNPVERAFRTASLVRGAYPYVLIVDDLKKDDRKRKYSWLLQILESNRIVSKSNNQIILSQGNERLLVRVIHSNEPTSSIFENFRVDRMVDNGGYDRVHANIGTKKRMIFEANAEEFQTKILIYPHAAGMPIPATSIAHNGDTIQIRFQDQHDVFEFEDVDGLLGYRFLRNGQFIASTAQK